MAKFVFRLQGILNLKARLEDQQRNVFAQARKTLNDEEAKLANLYERLEFYESEGRSMRERVLLLQDIKDNQNAISTVKEYIVEQKENVRLAEERLEEERIKLVELMKEHKTYERLREKAFDEYLESEKHTEGVVNDEHNSFVYGTKTS